VIEHGFELLPQLRADLDFVKIDAQVLCRSTAWAGSCRVASIAWWLSAALGAETSGML